MLINISKKPALVVGQKFVQYHPRNNFSYCDGRVKSINDESIVVDFGDMVISFLSTEIGYVINPDLGEEHYMSLAAGTIVADYRDTGNINEVDGARRGSRAPRSTR